MAEETPGQERTESATPKRLQEAREQGRIPRSVELNTAAVVLAGAAGLHFLGADAGKAMETMLQSGLALSREQATDPGYLIPTLGNDALRSLVGCLPLFGAITAAALAAPIALGGWNFSAAAALPNFGRLSVAAGFGRIFSLRGTVELGKSLAKFAIVGSIAAWVLWSDAGALLGLGNEGTAHGIVHAVRLAGAALLQVSTGLLLIAAIDVPFQLWQHSKDLSMTRQEVRQEFKEMEGSQEVKGKIRAMQRELAKRRMMQEVPKADVVVVNPTHYAVALRYDEKRMRAPRVVAKGTDLIAARIREIAAEHGVVVLEAPPLARALHRYVEIGAEIPAALYVAVAQVLSYVFQLRAARSAGMRSPAPPVIDAAVLPPEPVPGAPPGEA